MSHKHTCSFRQGSDHYITLQWWMSYRLILRLMAPSLKRVFCFPSSISYFFLLSLVWKYLSSTYSMVLLFSAYDITCLGPKAFSCLFQSTVLITVPAYVLDKLGTNSKVRTLKFNWIWYVLLDGNNENSKHLKFLNYLNKKKVIP